MILDQDTGETLIAGMGELHLEIYLERLKREYGVQVKAGKPRVNYRETVMSQIRFDHLLKKQTGGAGQYARVIGRLEPIAEEEEHDQEFVNSVIGGTIPPQYIPAVEKGYLDMMEKGPLFGYPVSRVRMVLEDGAFHAVDSSEYAFRNCTHTAFRKAFEQGTPSLLEPIMELKIVAPAEFQGTIVSNLHKRNGVIEQSKQVDSNSEIQGYVPLSKMFGYATELRSLTQGKGEFSMEYRKHEPVPRTEFVKIMQERDEKMQMSAGGGGDGKSKKK